MPETLNKARERARTRITRDKATIAIYKNNASPAGYYALSELDLIIDDKFKDFELVEEVKNDPKN